MEDVTSFMLRRYRSNSEKEELDIHSVSMRKMKCFVMYLYKISYKYKERI